MPKYYAIVNKKTGEIMGFKDSFRSCIYFFKTLKESKMFLRLHRDKKTDEIRTCQIKLGKRVK